MEHSYRWHSATRNKNKQKILKKYGILFLSHATSSLEVGHLGLISATSSFYLFAQAFLACDCHLVTTRSTSNITPTFWVDHKESLKNFKKLNTDPIP